MKKKIDKKKGAMAVGVITLIASVFLIKKFAFGQKNTPNIPAIPKGSGAEVADPYKNTKPVIPTTKDDNEIEDNFPLKIGTHNKFVKKLQMAVSRYSSIAGNVILRSGGFDGKFGEGTKRALVICRFPTNNISYSQYKSILKKGGIRE